MNREELLDEVIKNLLNNRDFMGLQLDMAFQNVDEIEYMDRSQKYLYTKSVNNLKEKIIYIKNLFDVDVETIATMLQCDIEDVEKYNA